jgi:hypothetical protein
VPSHTMHRKAWGLCPRDVTLIAEAKLVSALIVMVLLNPIRQCNTHTPRVRNTTVRCEFRGG